MAFVICGKTRQHETQGEHRERVASHYIVYFTQFNVIIGYSTVLTGLWPYLNKLDPEAGKSFLGYLVGFSALGQMLFSPAIGWWSNKLKSSRIPFVVCLIVCIISYSMHATLYLFPSNKKYWMLFSRFLAGVGAASVSLCRAHISSTTLIQERRKAVSTLSLFATIALALGPVLQWAVVALGESGVSILGPIKLDMYTTIGWIMTMLTVINLILLHPVVFKEHSMLGKEESSTEKEQYRSSNYKCLAWVFILMNFMVTFNFMFTKILATPMAMDEFAMGRLEATRLNSVIMIWSAIISFVTILTINPLCTIMSEMRVFLIGLLLLILGRGAFYPWGDGPPKTFDDKNTTCIDCPLVGCPLSQNWCPTERKVLFHQFIIGNVLENIGYSLSITLVMAIFSKVLGSKQQGTWMGFLTSLGSLARVTSPVFISTLYAHFGPGVVGLFTNLIFILAMFCLLKLKNHYLCRKQKEIENENEATPNLVVNVDAQAKDCSEEIETAQPKT